jgi:hypothetical protein
MQTEPYLNQYTAIKLGANDSLLYCMASEGWKFPNYVQTVLFICIQFPLLLPRLAFFSDNFEIFYLRKSYNTEHYILHAI